MIESRAYASAVMLNDSHWWITGGWNLFVNLEATELYDVETGRFSPFLDLPVGTFNHVVLKLDDSHFFVCCGDYMFGRTYILDLETEIWTQTPHSRFDHEEGLAGIQVSLRVMLRFLI